MLAKRTRVLPLAVIALLALTWAGCDSTDNEDEEEITDADVFVGTWAVDRVDADDENITVLVGTQIDLDETSVTFDEGGTFSGLAVSAGDESDRRQISGRYSVDESDGTITFTGDAFEEPATLNYAIESDDEIELTSNDSAFFAAFAGIDPEDFNLEINNLRIVLARQE